MKIYEIIDEELQKGLGYLFCFEKSKEYIIELSREIDEWDAPLLFQGKVHEGIYTILQNEAELWVRERVIPTDRQNLGMILKNAKLESYDEMKLLALSKGRCAQDNCYLREISYEEISEDVKSRRNGIIRECFLTEENRMICFFENGEVFKVPLTRFGAYATGLKKLISGEMEFEDVRPGPGGYSVVINGMFVIPTEGIRKQKNEPITANDFVNFIKNNTLNTTEACLELGCTRQNLSYLVKTGKTEPVRSGEKETLFSKGEIRRML